jgi:hypothetical protein
MSYLQLTSTQAARIRRYIPPCATRCAPRVRKAMAAESPATAAVREEHEARKQVMDAARLRERVLP